MKSNKVDIYKAVSIVAKYHEGWEWSEGRDYFYKTEYVAIPNKDGCKRQPVWDKECSVSTLTNTYLSLDKLSSVWEKLLFFKLSPRFTIAKDGKGYLCEIMYYRSRSTEWEVKYSDVGKTLQEAALLATAKAIESIYSGSSDSTGGDEE